MKKYMAIIVLLVFSPLMSFAQSPITLDEAIEESANFFSGKTSENVTVSVFNFSSDSKELSEYIIEELTIAFINAGMDVIDRNNLNEVNREIYYGFTGAVDDATAQAYGYDIGVQTVVLGSFTKSPDNTYRLRIQAIDVQTKRVHAAKIFSIKEDRRLATWLKIYEDYTVLERLGFGALNIIPGLGSAIQRDNKWWINTIIGSTGLLVTGVGMAKAYDGPILNATLLTGMTIFGVSIIYGFARPFFVHRPNNSGVSLADPNAWNIELVSSKDNILNGFKLTYTIKLKNEL
jgi:hypothetical protein